MPLQAIRPELVRRIVCEAEAVRAGFQHQFRLILDELGRPVWEGKVLVEGRTFPVRVTYPPAYPGVPPILETTLSLPTGCPHVLARCIGVSRLCWLAPNGHTHRRRWDPQRHTAATVLRAAQRWGLAFLVWQSIGTWPVPDAFEV